MGQYRCVDFPCVQAFILRSLPWKLVYPPGHEEDNEIDAKIKQPSSDVRNYTEIEISDDDKFFSHIYERNEQIAIVTNAVKVAIKSDLQQRLHTVLYGDPGSGKTEILRALGTSLGDENEAYLLLDATSSTKAGALKLLFEAENIPPVLIIEEAEKVADDDTLKWLLGITDQRGEIRKTNYRIGHQARNVKMLCYATVNDYDKWQRMSAGALASRFFEVYCPPPSREVCQKVLLREVLKMKGNPAWIEPALLLGFDELGWSDPRKLKHICLAGGDDLLSGKYQECIRRTRQPARSS